MIAHQASKLLVRSIVRPSVSQTGLSAFRTLPSTTASNVALFNTSKRLYSARPDTASGQRGGQAQGPVEGAAPTPQIGVSRSTSTLRVLAPSVLLMVAFIGWWFLGHKDQDHRKANIGVGAEGTNKLQGSKHHAAQQLASGERGPDGKPTGATTTSTLLHK